MHTATQAPAEATRVTLLRRIRHWDDAVSWDEFYHLYYNLVLGVAKRMGLAHADAEDIVQTVFAKVAETIDEFQPSETPGSFRTWLRNLTRWRVLDKMRERSREACLRRAPSAPQAPSDTREHTSTIERLPDDKALDDAWETEWKQHVLRVALSRLARKVAPKHFQAFELYTCQHWPVLKVSRELHINPATVYIISHRLTRKLRDEVRELQKKLD